MDDDVMDFLVKHVNEEGKVGEFVRSCILVGELAYGVTRDELKNSAQLGYLLDCFDCLQEDPDDEEISEEDEE